MDSLSIVWVSAPSTEVAEALADLLLEERLAACVSVLPGVRSHYRWQGKLERTEEVLLMIKTRNERLPGLMERVQQAHPYDVPEIVAVPAEAASSRYVEWVESETRVLVY